MKLEYKKQYFFGPIDSKERPNIETITKETEEIENLLQWFIKKLSKKSKIPFTK